MEHTTSLRLTEEEHFHEIHSVLKKQAGKWREIGFNLGFYPYELDLIQHTPLLLLDAPTSYLSEMLSQWLQWAPGDDRRSKYVATFNNLQSALNKTGLGETSSELQSKLGINTLPRECSSKHNSIGLQTSTTSCRCVRAIINVALLVLGMNLVVAGIAASIAMLSSISLHSPKSALPTSKQMVGRGEYFTELINITQCTDIQIVSLKGPPGIGKTSLAINLGNHLKQLGEEVYYVDMSGIEPNSSKLVAELLSVVGCLPWPITTFTQWFISKFSNYYTKTFGQWLLKNCWTKNMTGNTTLILDNVQNDWQSKQKELQEFLSALLEKSSNVRIIMTCHQVIHFDSETFNYNTKVLEVPSISTASCMQLFEQKVELSVSGFNINTASFRGICENIDNNPMAIVFVSAIINQKLLTPRKVIDLLASSNTTEQVSPFMNYLQEHVCNIAKVFTVFYQYFPSHFKNCAWLLADIRGSFTELDVEFFDPLNGSDCIAALYRYSLIETNDGINFHFNALFQSFIRWSGPYHKDESTRTYINTFWGNFIKYYIKPINKKMNNRTTYDSFVTAVRIGSDRNLTHSLLPLVPNYKFDFRHFFEMAFSTLTHFNINKTLYLMVINLQVNTSDIIWAYSFLIKVIYCPDLHPVEILGKNYVPQKYCKKCSEHLLKHRDSVINLYQSESGTARLRATSEAYAYYNGLIITICDVCGLPCAYDWQLHLDDFAHLVSIAMSECERFCKREGSCTCTSASNTELGLMYYAQGKNDLAIQQLTEPHSEYEHSCEILRKGVVTMTLYAISAKTEVRQTVLDEYLHTLNTTQTELKCYLMAYAQLIVPFLNFHNETLTASKLGIQWNNHYSRVNQTCEAKNRNEMHCLSERYRALYGWNLLKHFRKKWVTNLIFQTSQEESSLMCMLLQDATLDCGQFPNESFVPDNTIDDVVAMLANRSGEQWYALKPILSEEEFEKLHERAKSIPHFFLLLSL